MALEQITVFEPVVVRPRSADVVPKVHGSTMRHHPGNWCPHREAEMDRSLDPVHVLHSRGIAVDVGDDVVIVKRDRRLAGTCLYLRAHFAVTSQQPQRRSFAPLD